MRKQHPAAHLALLAFLSLFAFALYAEIFRYRTFFPEFPLLYFYADGLDLKQVLRSYANTSQMWYRPTSFTLIYWIGQHLAGWHDLLGWKLYHFSTLLGACCAIYWFAARCLGASPLAALLCVTYFIAQPSLLVIVMQIGGFDLIHIALAVLSAGLYLNSMRARGRRSVLLALAAWILFAAALTAKEVVLALPGFLLAASVLMSVLEPRKEPLRKTVIREAARLLPFIAVLPAYYSFHLAKVPADNFAASGLYRMAPNWDVILANARKLPLWILRIYAWTQDAPGTRMHQSTPLNNGVGFAAFALVAWQWWKRARRSRPLQLVLALMLAWVAVFLAIPIYSGGFIWHINLALVGYCVLFGMAAAWTVDAISAPGWRVAAAGALFAGALLLGRTNLHTELYDGVYATAFRINHALLDRPPVAAGRLGRAPLVYIEDRLGLGSWWYGCYGRLFDYVYLRHDVEEVVVPELASISPELKKKWLAHPNAFFFAYDDAYEWHDASAEFRSALLLGRVTPPVACAAAGGQVQFSLQPAGGSPAQDVRWSVVPPGGGTITAAGLYSAPEKLSGGGVARVLAGAPDPALRASALVRFPATVPIRIAAGAPPGTRLPEGWAADSHYEGGTTYSSGRPVRATGALELYRHERSSGKPFSYRFCVEPGTYRVTLKFAELWFTEPGRRLFDVEINGTPVLARFDIVREAGGPNRAVDRAFRIEAAQGEILIGFTPVVSSPKIGAIEIAR